MPDTREQCAAGVQCDGVSLIMPADAGLAQLVVHLICNQGVTGSNPVAGTKIFINQTLIVVPCQLRLRRVARFPLVTNSENQYNTLLLFIAIESHIATLAVGDH
jgi:hypothetical protein